LDAAILMNPEVWVASGHVTNFNDPLIDCKKCKSRHRADKLIEEFTKGEETGDGWDNKKIEKFIADNKIACPKCGSTNVDLYTRIIGYLTKIKNWSAGRYEEHKTRIYTNTSLKTGDYKTYETA
jgi:glycyl-tRNA synthetase